MELGCIPNLNFIIACFRVHNSVRVRDNERLGCIPNLNFIITSYVKE